MANGAPWSHTEFLYHKVADPGDTELGKLLTTLSKQGWDEFDVLEGDPDPVDGKADVIVAATRDCCGYCANGFEMAKRNERIRELRNEIKKLKAELKEAREAKQ